MIRHPGASSASLQSILRILRRLLVSLPARAFTATVFALTVSGSAFAALNVSMSVPAPFVNPINPGDITALRISISNSNSASTITGVTFTNNLPPQLVIAGAGEYNYICVDGFGVGFPTTGAVTAVVGTGTISLTGGTIPLAQPSGASGTCNIDVQVTSTVQGGVWTDNIGTGAVTGIDSSGAVSNGSPAAQSITVNTLNPPTIAKNFSLATVVKTDQTVRLTITISNAANPGVNLPLDTLSDTPPFAIQDNLPAGLQVAATPNATSTCSGAGVAPAFAPAAAATLLTAVGGTVAAGGTCTLMVDLVGTSTGGGYSQSVTNTINRTTDFANERGLAAAANATASLTIVSQISVAKAFNPGTVSAGQTANLVITITNASPVSTETLTTFTDSPIDGVGNALYGLKVGVPTTTCAGGVAAATAGNFGVTLTGGSLPPSSSCTVTVPYVATLQTPGTPQTFTNTIPAGAVGVADPTVVSKAAVASVTVVDQLTVTKSSNPAIAAPGNPVQYTITVNNYTATALSNVKITDALPSGIIALPALPAPPTLSGTGCLTLTNDIPALPATTSTPHFTIASFPAGVGPSPGTCTVTFWAMLPSSAVVGAVLSNSIAAGGVINNSGIGPPTATNAGGSGNANVTVASDVTVNKVFTPANASEGTVSQLTVTFTNLSAQPLTNASFTDNFPTGTPAGLQLVVANPASASSTCVGAAITATPGASSVSMSGATIPARAANGTGANGTCTLKVDVIGPAGLYVNTLPSGALTGTETNADTTTTVANSPGPISASITYTSALTAIKSFAPATISAGGKSTVTVRLGNVGTGTLNNVSVTDPLPAGLVVATPPNAFTTCGGTPVVTAAAGATSVNMTGAVIPANIQCNLLFDVIGSGGVNWVNTIPIGNVTATGGVQNVTPVTATLTNNTTGAVSVTNNTAPNSLTAPGQVSVLTVTLTNGGAIALSSLSLTNYFTVDGTSGGALTAMVISSTPGATTTCPGGVVTAVAGGTSVTLSGASLAAAASCTVSVNVTLTAAGTVQDTIPVGAISTAQGISNTLLTVTSLSAGANVGVTKRFVPAVAQPGVRTQLQITVINAINLPVTGLTVTDNLPLGVTVPASPNASTTCTGATVTAPTPSQIVLTGGSLAAAATGSSTICTIFIDVVAAAAGNYVNTINPGDVTGTAGGSATSNPIAGSATLGVLNPASITKNFATATVAPGAPDTVTLTIANPNAIALTGAVLMDSLPTNLTVALVPNASTTCGGVVTTSPSATSVVLTGGTIPAAGSCNVKFDTVSNIAGTYINTVPGGNLATTQGVTNANPASATVNVLNPPTVSKQFTPASIAASGTSQLTIVLGNTNASAATLTGALVDTLPTSPANIIVATPNGLSGTCTLASVTAVAGSGSVTYASGATIPAGGCVINVNVTGSTTGTYTNSFATGALQTTLGNSVQAVSANLVISPLGFISGRVFDDNSVVPNGVFGGIDTPIPNVTINLTGTDYGPNGVLGGGDDFPVSFSTTTDALGNYNFFGLDAGNYTVTEPAQPAGTVNGITTAGPVAGGGGGTAGTATTVAVTPSAVSNIILLRNAGTTANSTGNNFAEVIPSTISGTAFLDQNNDGIQEAGDTPLVGVTIQLLNGASTVIATTTTNASGNYSFIGLAPGTYSILEPAQPPNTANGKTTAGTVANGGTAGTPTVQTVVPSEIAGIVLPPNTVTTGNNFAEVPAGRQVLGRVFVDTNNDGIFNGSDTGISGYTVALTGIDFNGIAVNQTAVTAADGSYVFGGLAAGTYNVTEPTQPPGTLNGITTAGSTSGVATAVSVTPSSITGINLNGTNTISTGNNFAEVPAPNPLGAISGYVYVDANNNGVDDIGEAGIAGVVIKLTGTDIHGNPVNLSTVSFANNGAWSFANLQPSNSAGYTITEIQPAGYADGKTTVSAGAPGTPVSAKPAAAGGNDVITGVVVGTSIVEFYDFGELPLGGSISGNVYVDLNNNGVEDPGEPGIAGVTITLTGTDNTGKAVNISVQTGPNGAYSFAGLAPSNTAGYSIAETQPAGYANGKDALGSLGGTLGNDVVTGIVLTGGAAGTGYNFGELQPASLAQTKTAVNLNGGDLVPGDVILYTITTTNTGQSAAANVTVFDGAISGAPFPPLIQGTSPTVYVANSTTSNGVPVPDVGGVSPLATNTGLNVGSLAPGASNVVTVKVQIPASAPGGNVVNNASFNVPAAGGTPAITGTSTVTVKVVVTTASVSGHVWLDANHNRILDPGETLEPGWTVELLLNGTVIRSAVTDQNGFYQFTGLAPGSGYQIRFRDPTSGVIFGRPVTNEQNNGSNPAGANTSDGTLNGMTLTAGENVVQQSLPLDPSGVVYNAVTRVPVQGATVQIQGPAGFNPATNLVGGALMTQTGATSASQVTGADGYYEFLFINLGLPGGPPAGTYVISVTPPAGGGYVTAQPSKLIPPTAATFTVPGPSNGVDPIQAQSNAPPNGAPTTYYLGLVFGPGSAGVVNNHIPLDPVQTGTILISKTSSAVNVSRGDLVPYTITAINSTANALTNIRVSDVIPPGFKFRVGSASLNGVALAPTVNGRELDWSGLSFAPSEKKTFRLMLIVGSGVGDGEFTNQSFASIVPVAGTTGTVVSNVGTATVRVTPDPLFDCPDLIGKVFDDRNFNGYQDEGEPGIANVRLVTVEGLVVTTDSFGRYHITCPMIPNEFRGSNFVVKLDVRTLPAGYRVTTENPATVRLTAGKMSKLNFGAAIMRVFRIELNGDAFDGASRGLKPEWLAKLDDLMQMLRERPSVVRIAYSQRNADEPAQQRLDAVAAEIRRRWDQTKCCYTLAIETELVGAGTGNSTGANKGAGAGQ